MKGVKGSISKGRGHPNRRHHHGIFRVPRPHAELHTDSWTVSGSEGSGVFYLVLMDQAEINNWKAMPKHGGQRDIELAGLAVELAEDPSGGVQDS